MGMAKWLTGSGKAISGEGLEPDVKVEITKENIEGEKDPQLERSVQEVLKL